MYRRCHIFSKTTSWHPFNCLLSFHLRFLTFEIRSHHLYKQTIFRLQFFSLHFFFFFFSSLRLLYFRLLIRSHLLLPHHSCLYTLLLPIDLIWFIRFTSGFDIPKEIPFIWPRLTYFQWKIMFKWWKKIPLCCCQTIYLNGVKRISVLFPCTPNPWSPFPCH